MGKFIVFEGLDGSGKTTQISLLSQYLKKRGVVCCCTKEPSDGPIGALVRGAVRGSIEFEPESMALLFAADRAEHLAAEICPALAKGEIVLCDRFLLSNLAYQGTQISMKDIISFNKYNLRPVPDITIFIDTEPAECTKRIINTRVEMEIYDGIEYASRIRTQYFSAFQLLDNYMKVVVIDGNKNEKDVFSRILECLSIFKL